MYEIGIAPEAIIEIEAMPVFYRRLVEKAIDRQLPQSPLERTKNRKCLKGLAAGFEFEEPLWELRVGDWRIFYDVNEEAKVIVIRAVRFKETGKTTREIV